MAYLIVVDTDGSAYAAHRLDDTPLTIGRGPSNGAIVVDDTVSRAHARIEFVDGRHWLVDLGSRHGTFANGARIERHALTPKDRLQIGRRRLLYRAALTEPKTATRIGMVDGRALLAQISELVGALPDSRVLVQKLLTLAIQSSGAERGAVTLVDDDAPVAVEARIERIPRAIATAVLETGETIRVARAHEAASFESSVSLKDAGVRSAMCVPVRAEGTIAALIYVDDRRPDRFGADEEAHMRAIATVAGAALTGSRLLERARARARAEGSGPRSEMLGGSEAMAAVRRLVDRCAEVDSTVLVTGETGTGKELVARALHAKGARADQPFVAVNCAAIPRDLIESELFGHEQGAFTGAIRRRRGTFEAAHGGTIFLDEIGELDAAVQAKLLRVLEERRVTRLGAEASKPVDVRVVAATNRVLEQEVDEGRFREDLLYRLRVVEIPLPPLRERAEDIRLIADHFCTLLGPRLGRAGVSIAPDAMALLERHGWRGNVRELKNEIERALILGHGRRIEATDLALGTTTTPKPDAPPEDFTARWSAITDAERQLIEAAMAKTEGNVVAAAKLLGIGRGMLRTKLSKYTQ